MTAPLFTGEAMLLSWGDTSARGKTVTFQLHEDDCGEIHPFRDLGTGKHGQRFRLIAQPIGDDDEPLVSPGARREAGGGTPAVSAAPPPSEAADAPGEARTYTLANRIGMRCNDAAFQDWAIQFAISSRWSVGEAPADCPGKNRAEVTASIVRRYCGVETRADIRPNTDAGIMWSNLELQYLQATGQMAEAR